jgi:3-oxoacyl-[acyl-carrier protein] reductase
VISGWPSSRGPREGSERPPRSGSPPDGFAVAVLDLDEASTGDTVKAIEAEGGRALGVGVDVSKADQVEAAVERVAASSARPVVLVNNAGITRDNMLFKMSEDDWDAVLGVHLRGHFLMTAPRRST